MAISTTLNNAWVLWNKRWLHLRLCLLGAVALWGIGFLLSGVDFLHKKRAAFTLIAFFAILIVGHIIRRGVFFYRYPQGLGFYTRTLILFVGLCLVPLGCVTFVVATVPQWSVQRWISPHIDRMFTNANALLNVYGEERIHVASIQAHGIAEDMQAVHFMQQPLKSKHRSLRVINERYALFGTIVFDDKGHVIVHQSMVSLPRLIGPFQTEGGQILTSSGHLVVYAPITPRYFVAIIPYTQPELLNQIQKTSQSLEAYRGFASQHVSIERHIEQTLLWIICIVFFYTLYVALHMAYILTNPLSRLLRAVDRPFLKETLSYEALRQELTDLTKDAMPDFLQLTRILFRIVEKLDQQQKRLLDAQKQEVWLHVARRMAHEVKNPLTPIQLAMERMQHRYTSILQDERFERLIHTALRQVHIIRTLIDEFALFARLPQMQKNRISMNALIEGVTILMRESFKDASIIMRMPHIDMCTTGDEQQLQRALLNIMKNAFESMMAHKPDDAAAWQLTIIVKKSDKIHETNGEPNQSYIVIHIIDEGIGLQESAEQLYKEYYTSRFQGTGLGLAIVRKIAQDHKGFFRLENRVDGAQGAMATLCIPLHEDI